MGKLEGAFKDKFKDFFPPHHVKLFGPNSLLVQSGPGHTRIRTLIMSSLTPAVVNTYQPLVEQSIREFFDDLRNEQRQSSFDDAYTKLVTKILTLFTSMLLQVVLGTTNVAGDLVEDLSIWTKGLLAPPLTMIPFTTTGKAMKARAQVVDKLSAVMDDPTALKERGLLKKLLDAQDEDGMARLTREEIIDNLFTLVFAGSDTTSAAATSICKTLGEHQGVRQALIDHPASIEPFVAQTLGAFPSAPFQMREISQGLEFEGYRIPNGWLVCYGYASALWDEHEEITVKSVWKHEGEAIQNPAQAVAFGSGPRKCPGRYLAVYELLIFTELLLQNPLELTSNQNLEQRYTPEFFPVDGLEAKLTSK